MGIENEILERATQIVEAEKNEVETKEPTVSIPTPTLSVESTDKSLTEQASDIVGVLATQNAINDEQLVEDITQTKKQELREGAEAHLKTEKAKNMEADIKLQEADYGVYSGIATYAGLKKPLPKHFQKFVFLVLQWLFAPFIIFFGAITGIINIVIDCTNSIVEKLAKTAKAVKILVISLLSVFGVALVIFVVVFLVNKYILIG